MPCNCDHLEPNSTERKMSKVACLLDEFKGKKINRSHWNGMHPDVYSQTYDRYAPYRDHKEMIKALVAKIENCDLTQQSLEMQMWWRDYQLVKEKKVKKKKKSDRDIALGKLTAKDKKALGIED